MESGGQTEIVAYCLTISKRQVLPLDLAARGLERECFQKQNGGCRGCQGTGVL